jgi:tetratricopeptide (TPR) repeat protein
MCAHLASGFFDLLHGRGFWNEAALCLETGWLAAGALNEEGLGLRAHLRHKRASLAHDMGDLDQARAEAEQNLDDFGKLGDRAGEAKALNFLALLATDTDAIQDAQILCEKALERWPVGHAAGRAKTLHNLARLASKRGDSDAAQQLYEDCLVQRKRAGDARGEAETVGNLGVIAQERGDIPKARTFYTQSLTLRRALRDSYGIAIMLHNLGELAELDSEFERALVLYLHAERIFSELRSPYAAAPRSMMQRMQQRLSENEYALLLERAEAATWEDKV